MTLDNLRSNSHLIRDACQFPTKLLPRFRSLRILNPSGLANFDYNDVCEFLAQRKYGATQESPDLLEEVELVVPRRRHFGLTSNVGYFLLSGPRWGRRVRGSTLSLTSIFVYDSNLKL